MADNRCVCCGEIIPEGLQVCIKCRKKADDGGQHDHQMHREDGGRLDYKGTD